MAFIDMRRLAVIVQPIDSNAAMQSSDKAQSDRASADAPMAIDQRRCWVNQRAVDVSPGIANMGSDDGATQKATQAVKTLEAHKTRWSRNQRELKTAAYLGGKTTDVRR